MFPSAQMQVMTWEHFVWGVAWRATKGSVSPLSYGPTVRPPYAHTDGVVSAHYGSKPATCLSCLSRAKPNLSCIPPSMFFSLFFFFASRRWVVLRKRRMMLYFWFLHSDVDDDKRYAWIFVVPLFCFPFFVSADFHWFVFSIFFPLPFSPVLLSFSVSGNFCFNLRLC